MAGELFGNADGWKAGGALTGPPSDDPAFPPCESVLRGAGMEGEVAFNGAGA